MKRVLFTLAALCTFVCHQSQAQVTVTFKLDAKEYLQTGGAFFDDAYIAGNFTSRGCPELTDWQPPQGKMILWRDSIYIRTLEFDGTAFDSLMWKYVRSNSWGPGDEGGSWLPPDPSCVKVTDNNNRKFLLPFTGNIVLTSKWAKCHSVTNTTARPPATLTALGSTTVCGNDSVRLKANGGPGYSYVWSRNGIRIGYSTDSVYVAKIPGKYTVVVVNSDGASRVSDTTGVKITVNPIPSAVISAQSPLMFCSGDSVTLLASTGPGYAYQWNKQGIAIPNATDSTMKVFQSGTYSLTTLRGGCSKTSDTLIITAKPLPDASVLIVGSTTFCMGGSVGLSAGSGLETYQWHRNTIPLPGDTLGAFSANTSGAYSVLITLNGCSKLSDPVNVLVHPLPQPVIDSGNVLSTGTFTSYQWLLNGIQISGATFSAFAPAATGLYSVVVTDGNGCSDTSAAIQFTFTGIENRLTRSVTIYPNPSENQFAVHIMNSEDAIAQIRMYDMSGRLVHAGKFQNTSDVSVGENLKPGLYMLEVQLSSGVTERIRLVKN